MYGNKTQKIKKKISVPMEQWNLFYLWCMGKYEYSGACGGAWLQECRQDGKGWRRKIKQQNGVKKISTVIYYYSATGNSLYVAREL